MRQDRRITEKGLSRNTPLIVKINHTDINAAATLAPRTASDSSIRESIPHSRLPPQSSMKIGFSDAASNNSN
jgi:hypothetical protein